MRILRCAWVLPVSSEPIRDGAVVVEGGEIVAVGPTASILPTHGRSNEVLRSPPEIVDLGNGILLPAFVNAHTHFELSWMASAPPPRGDLIAWIRTMIARRPPPDSALLPSIERAIDSVRGSGTALVADVGNSTSALPLLEGSGLRGCFFLEVIRRRVDDSDPVALASRKLDAGARLDSGDSSGADRFRSSIVPHSPTAGSLSPGLLVEIGDRARRLGDIVSMHVAESRADVEFLMTGQGPLRPLFEEIGAIAQGWNPPRLSPAQVLDEAGLLGPRSLVVHGVHLSRDEIRLLAKRGTTVVMCPRSNAWIGVGEAPVAMFVAEGVRLALGTDSLASNHDLDIRAELATLRGLAPRVEPSILLRAATLGGAEALGLGASFGSLDAGKTAALVVLRRRPQGDSAKHLSHPPSSCQEPKTGLDPDIAPIHWQSEVREPEPEPWSTLFAHPRDVILEPL